MIKRVLAIVGHSSYELLGFFNCNFFVTLRFIMLELQIFKTK